MNRVDQIKYEEGFRAKPYHCPTGYPTIGYGKKLGPKFASLKNYQFTVNEKIAELWLEQELDIIDSAFKDNAVYNSLDEFRQTLIVNMAYQMGVTGVLKFRKMWAALGRGDWESAKKEALDSRWARQTPVRAARVADALVSGYYDI